jgi:hypothetical protein
VDVADVGVDGRMDGVDQAIGQPQGVALRQALPRAELVVDGLDSVMADQSRVCSRSRIASSTESRSRTRDASA